MRVVTEQELKVRGVFSRLKDLNYNFDMLTEQIFCFKCGRFWKSDYERPEGCAQCGYAYETKGNEEAPYARPDIVLRIEVAMATNIPGPPPPPMYYYSVVRVDEEALHRKNKKRIMRDYVQTKGFEHWGIKVFIILNEEVDDYYPWRLLPMAKFFVDATFDDRLYELYKDDKDIRYRFSG